MLTLQFTFNFRLIDSAHQYIIGECFIIVRREFGRVAFIAALKPSFGTRGLCWAWLPSTHAGTRGLFWAWLPSTQASVRGGSADTGCTQAKLRYEGALLGLAALNPGFGTRGLCWAWLPSTKASVQGGSAEPGCPQPNQAGTRGLCWAWLPSTQASVRGGLLNLAALNPVFGTRGLCWAWLPSTQASVRGGSAEPGCPQPKPVRGGSAEPGYHQHKLWYDGALVILAGLNQSFGTRGLCWAWVPSSPGVRGSAETGCTQALVWGAVMSLGALKSWCEGLCCAWLPSSPGVSY